jgi:hypothetical protein
MMDWPEQAQHLAERYIFCFHLIVLICMRKKIASSYRPWVPDLSAQADIWSHYFTRSGYGTIQLLMMYWPGQAQSLAE